MPEKTGVNQSVSQTLCSWLPMQFGSPVGWEAALNQEHLGMHGVSSSRHQLYLIPQSQVRSCPRQLCLASGRHIANLQSSIHTLIRNNHTYRTQQALREGGARRKRSPKGGSASTHPQADFCLLAFCLATVWTSKDALCSKLFSMAKASVKRLGLQ